MPCPGCQDIRLSQILLPGRTGLTLPAFPETSRDGVSTSHLHFPSAVQRENPEWVTPGFVTKIPELGLVRAHSSTPVLPMTCSRALLPSYNSQHKNFGRTLTLTMPVPIPVDAAQMSKISQSGGKNPKQIRIWVLLQALGHQVGALWDSREGEGKAHLPRSWLQDRDWSLSTGTKILLSLPHRWAATGSRWEQAEGEKDFKARSLWQPRLKGHNAFWIKERDCFHLSSYKNNPRGKQRGKRRRQWEVLSAQLSSLHQPWIRPPSDSGRLRFPE